jgi:transcriptional regulator with XRE-family HTH domain
VTAFSEWRAAMNLTAQQAAEALGLHMRTVQRYDTADDERIPKHVKLACAYLRLMRDLQALLKDWRP